jgi:replicative DNA helicase
MAERVMPHDLQAERSVLGAVFISPDGYDVAAAVGLKAGMFFRTGHARIWQAMGRLRDAGTVIDPITLRAALETAGALDEAGGMLYLAGLVDGVPRASNIDGYARLVRDKARLRELIAAAQSIVADAFEYPEVDDLLDLSEQRIMAVSRDTSRGEFVLSADWMSEMFGAVEKAYTERRLITGVPCGLRSIDYATRGFQPGELILIAARPSVGKTALGLQFALEASKHVLTAFVSMEMSRQSIGFRAVAQEARLDAVRLMTGQFGDRENRQVGEAISRLGERRLAIDDTSAQNISALCAKLRRLSSRYGLGAVFVDYLQLMHATGSENRTQEIGQISGRLKALAKDLQIPVIALCQLTRENEREKRRPKLSDLRESGNLEQDADVAILIHRPNKPEDTAKYQPGEVVELIMAKQRNGPAGMTIEVAWDGPTMRFTDIERREGVA